MNDMGDNNKEKEQKIPLLNSIFGENSNGENGLKVFEDTWVHNGGWTKSEYVKANVLMIVAGGVFGVVANLTLVENTIENDKTLSQENISIIQDRANGYAAIKAEDGSQLYDLSDDMSKITLITDIEQAQETAQKVVNYFEDAQDASFVNGFPELVQAKHITIELDDGNKTVIRNLIEADILSIYNPATYSQDQIALWGDVLSDIKNGRYNVPNIETFPLRESKTQAMSSPSSFLAGAFVLNALLHSGLLAVGRVYPTVRQIIPKLSRPGFGRRKDAPESENSDPSL